MTPATDPVEAAARTLERGGVVVYPTDTLWGLGARISDEPAVRRVFELKQRPLKEPLSIAVSSTTEIATYAVVTPAARRLFGLLPGALTLVLDKKDDVPDLVTAGRKDVGIRVPNHPDALRLLARAGPLTSTSANLHGAPEPKTLEDACTVFATRVDFYLPGSTAPVGAASTIVDARTPSCKILRRGAILESRIRELVAE